MSPDLSYEPEPRNLGEHATEILPDLDLLAEQLRADTGDALPKLAQLWARIGPDVFGPGGEIPPDLEREREEILGFARHAVEALQQCRGMEIRLMPEEEIGLLALLAFTSRPVIPVQDGRLATPPPAWEDLGRLHRTEIETVLRSVGRIETSGHPALSWAGTAWVAAPGIVLTSRHAVQRFAAPDGGKRWRVQEGLTVRIDFGERRSSDVPSDAEIRVHPVYDLAVVPVARAGLPAPLSILADGGKVRAGRRIYVAGHPESDDQTESLLRYRLFQWIAGVKCLLPGQVLQVLPEASTFLHDSSTLGGSSGSPVVDLETGKVIGLQGAGVQGPAHRAVALWRLADGPLLREAGVRL
jgi:hypothetical protein